MGGTGSRLGYAHTWYFDLDMLARAQRLMASEEESLRLDGEWKLAVLVLNAAAHGRSLATLLHPEIVFTRLFGSIAEGETRSSFQARANVLDYIKDDVKRARRELGSVENEKMDAYLSAYERLDTTSKRLVESRETLEQVVPKRTDKFSSKIETDRLDAHFELATAALIGGLTARRSPRELVFPTSISPSAD